MPAHKPRDAAGGASERQPTHDVARPRRPSTVRSPCGLLLALPLWFAPLFVAGCEWLPPTNPFDPLAPPEEQAPASLTGRVVVIDDADDIHRAGVLGVLRVGLLDGDGRRLERGGQALALPLVGIAEQDVSDDGRGRAAGTFVFEDLVPGRYTIVLDQPPSTYVPPPLPAVELVAGADVTIDDLVFSSAPDAAGDGPGVIEGTVDTVGVAPGQHRVTLLQPRDGAVFVVASTVSRGDFRFSGLGFSSYAVVVEGDDVTPVYRLGVRVGPDDGAGAQLQHQFSGDDALVVHPLTGALAPRLDAGSFVLDEGELLLRGQEAPILVLPFATSVEEELGITGMRLSTSSTFFDEAGEPLPFTPHVTSATIPVPDEDGEVALFAQFEARSDDDAFTFVSPTATLRLTKDTTPPTVRAVRILGLEDDDSGRALSPARTLALSIDAEDETSGIDAVGVAIDTAPTVFSDITTARGMTTVQAQVVAEDDGVHEVVVVVEDRAGNRSVPVRVPVLIDSVAPRVSLQIREADGGLLRGRVATLEVQSLVPGDDDLAIAVGLEGSVDEDDLGGPGERVVLLPAAFAHGAAVTFQAIAIDGVGNRSSVTQTVTLDLRGSLRGVVVSDAFPAVVPSLAGATVTLLDSDGAVIAAPIEVDGDGAFAFAGVPEQQGYVVRAALLGHVDTVVRGVGVTARSTTSLDPLALVLLRSELRGRALRTDASDDAARHAGIVVEARLVSPHGRVFVDAATTAVDGRFTLRGLPSALPGETLVLRARAAGYGDATASAVADASLVVVEAPLRLPLVRGDFDVCRPDDAGCTPQRFFGDDIVALRLRETAGVEALHVAVGARPPTRVLLDSANRTTVSVAGLDDGEVVLSVQLERAGGALGDPQTATFVRDTQAPTGVTIVRRSLATVADTQFVTGADVDVVVSADVDIGLTAPHVAARVVVADTPVARPEANFIPCALDVVCRVPLPEREGSHHVYAFVCDAADNCAASVELVIVRDATPPANASVRIADGAALTATVTTLVRFDAVELGGEAFLKIVTPDNDVDVEEFVAVSLPHIATVELEDDIDDDGAKAVLAVFRDAAGNETTAVADGIVLDRRAPTPVADVPCPVATQVVCLNGGDEVGGSVSVVLQATTSVVTGQPLTNATEMQIAVDGDADTEPFIPYAPTHVVLLPSSGPATKTVAVRFRDAAGNTSAMFIDDIELDTTAPTVPVLVADEVVTAEGTFVLSLASPSSDTHFDRHEVLGAQFTTFTTFDGSSVLLELPTDGARVVRVRGVDRAGNRSADVSVTVIRDTESPTTPALVGEGVDRFERVSSVTVPLALGSTDEHFVGYQVCAAPPPATSCDDADFVDAPGQTVFTFPLAPERAQSFCVRGRDAASTVPPGDSTPGNKSEASCIRVIHDDVPPSAPALEEAAPLVVGTRTRLFFRSGASYGDEHFSHWVLRGGAYADATPLCPAALPPLCPQASEGRAILLDPPSAGPLALEVDVRREALNELEVRTVDRAGNVSAPTLVAFREVSVTRAAGVENARRVTEIDAHGQHVVVVEQVRSSANSDRARVVGAGADLVWDNDGREDVVLTEAGNLVDSFSGGGVFPAVNRVSLARNAVVWLEKSSGTDAPRPGEIRVRTKGADGLFGTGDEETTTVEPQTGCGASPAMRWGPQLDPLGTALVFSCQTVADEQRRFAIIRVTPGDDGVFGNRVGFGDDDVHEVLVDDPDSDDLFPVVMGPSVAYYRVTDTAPGATGADMTVRVHSAGEDSVFHTVDDVDTEVEAARPHTGTPARLGLFLDPDPLAPACQQGLVWTASRDVLVRLRSGQDVTTAREVGLLRTPGADRILGSDDDVTVQLPYAEAPTNPGVNEAGIARGVITLTGSTTRLIVTPGKNRCFDGGGDDEVRVEFAASIGATAAAADAWYEAKALTTSTSELRRHDELRRAPFYWRTSMGESFGGAALGGDSVFFQTDLGEATPVGSVVDFGDRRLRTAASFSFQNAIYLHSSLRHARISRSSGGGVIVQEHGLDGALFTVDDPAPTTVVPLSELDQGSLLVSGMRSQTDLAEDLFVAARRSGTDVVLRAWFAGDDGVWNDDDPTRCDVDIVDGPGRRTELQADGRAVAFVTEVDGALSGSLSVWETTETTPCAPTGARVTTLAADGLGRPMLAGRQVAALTADGNGYIRQGGSGDGAVVLWAATDPSGLFGDGITSRATCTPPSGAYAWQVDAHNRGVLTAGRVLVVARAATGVTTTWVCDTAGGELSVVDIGHQSALFVDGLGDRALIAGSSTEGFSGGLLLELGR